MAACFRITGLDTPAYRELGSAFPASVRDVPGIAFGSHGGAEYSTMALMASMHVMSGPFPAHTYKGVYAAANQNNKADKSQCVHS